MPAGDKRYKRGTVGTASGCRIPEVSASDEEYKPRTCARKVASKPVSSDGKQSVTPGSSPAAPPPAQGVSVLHCLAAGEEPPLSAEALEKAKASADASKQSSSSFLR